MNIFDLQPYMSLFLDLAAIIAVLYGARKYLKSPHNDLERRVTTLEVKQADMERSLKDGNDNFRHQREVNEDIQTCILALVDFELSYCSSTSYKGDTVDLQEAKKILRQRRAKS